MISTATSPAPPHPPPPLCLAIWWLGGCAGTGGLLAWHGSAALGFLLLWTYLLPPLLARALGHAAVFGALIPASPGYRRWLRLDGLQEIYNRLPWLEEALRLLPGGYSAWLRLWGSRIGRDVRWRAGVRVTERYLLDIGDGVILETGCHLHGHAWANEQRLLVDAIRLAPHSIVGAGASIGPGCVLYPREILPAGEALPPFTMVRHQRRMSLLKTSPVPRCPPIFSV